MGIDTHWDPPQVEFMEGSGPSYVSYSEDTDVGLTSHT